MYDRIRDEFYNVMDSSNMNIRQKNVKYASLMTVLENYYHIPVLAENCTDVDSKILALYREISYARCFGGASE